VGIGDGVCQSRCRAVAGDGGEEVGALQDE